MAMANAKHALLGGTQVSKCALGCMSFGSPMHHGVGRHQWTIDDQALGIKLFELAVERGVNFFDTANVYSSGDSEVCTGNYLRKLGLNRSEFVLATKFGLQMTNGLNGSGASRKHIIESINASLERLGMDYVDLLIIHRLDGRTPPEETMEALHDVVKSGKALHIGASSMYAYEFAKLQQVAKVNKWTPFVSMQNHYNLLYREEEREMLPMLRDENVLCTPWSPLARGILARPPKADQTDRASKDPVLSTYQDISCEQTLINVGKVADDLGTSRSAVGLAWLISKGCVPIVGATSYEQLSESLDAMDIDLSAEHIQLLESAYRPLVHGIGIGRDPKQWDSK